VYRPVQLAIMSAMWGNNYYCWDYLHNQPAYRLDHIWRVMTAVLRAPNTAVFRYLRSTTAILVSAIELALALVPRRFAHNTNPVSS
jgi:hypothetical protein